MTNTHTDKAFYSSGCRNVGCQVLITKQTTSNNILIGGVQSLIFKLRLAISLLIPTA